MENGQKNHSSLVKSLMAKIAVLEDDLVGRNSIILQHDSVIKKHESTNSKLIAYLEEAKFQIEQLKRMIFGSKRERFVPEMDSCQLSLKFEPKAQEIDEEVTRY